MTPRPAHQEQPPEARGSGEIITLLRDGRFSGNGPAILALIATLGAGYGGYTMGKESGPPPIEVTTGGVPRAEYDKHVQWGETQASRHDRLLEELKGSLATQSASLREIQDDVREVRSMLLQLGARPTRYRASTGDDAAASSVASLALVPGHDK